MKRLSLAIVLILSPMMAQAWPWSQDMANQISIKPQENVNDASPGMAIFPTRSVPKHGTTTYVKDKDAAFDLKNPVPADEKSVAKGRKLFEIYCVPCHGKKGKGDGYVGEKLILTPFDLTTDSLAEMPDGYLFGMMTFGGAVMPPYAYDLSATERWHIVNFVRKSLRKAQAAQAEAPAK